MFIFWLWISFTTSLCLASCPTDEICEPQFKKCYKFMEKEKDFFSAEEECQFQGGHLVSFMNAFEQGTVEDVAASMFVGSTDYWIGANKFTYESWSWTDGSKWGYTNWFPGQESGSGSVASAELGSGKWMTSKDNSHKPFICGLPYSGKNTTVSTTPVPTPAGVAIPPEPISQLTSPLIEIILKQSFSAAEKQCNSLGAHLASAHSKAENDFIAVRSHSKISGVWYWTDSTPVWKQCRYIREHFSVDYTIWATGEPSNSGSIENCVELAADDMNQNILKPFLWMWNDTVCDEILRAAVCKKSEV